MTAHFGVTALRFVPGITVVAGAELAMTQVWVASQWLASFQHSAEAARHFVATANGYRARCHRCGAIYCDDNPADDRLGLRACARCIDPWVTLCLSNPANVGRLPGDGEFFCPTCARVLPREQLVPAEPSGKQRWVCRACRHVQVRMAEWRRGIIRTRPVPPVPVQHTRAPLQCRGRRLSALGGILRK